MSNIKNMSNTKTNTNKPTGKINFREHIHRHMNFPKKGVAYWDCTPIFTHPVIFRKAILTLIAHFKNKNITKIAAIEAKGFVIGVALAFTMNKPLVLIRKPALLPGKVLRETFVKEYGIGEYQLQDGALNRGDSVLIVYDILAGAGATQAAINLVEKAGATVSGCAFLTELLYLEGREALQGYDLFSLVKFNKKN